MTTTIPTTETVLRTVSRSLADRSFVLASVGLHKLDGNAQAYWTATAEVYESHGTWSGRARYDNKREPDLSGMVHADIVRAWPSLAPIVALHLSDPDGTPLYAYANGVHHLRQNDRAAAARLWRCSLEDLPPAGSSTATYEAFVEAQRDRWRGESAEAWEILQGLDVGGER